MEYFNLPVNNFVIADCQLLRDSYIFTEFEKADNFINELRKLYPENTYILYARLDV